MSLVSPACLRTSCAPSGCFDPRYCIYINFFFLCKNKSGKGRGHTIGSYDEDGDGQLVDTSELAFDVCVTFVVREEHLLRVLDAQDRRCAGS